LQQEPPVLQPVLQLVLQPLSQQGVQLQRLWHRRANRPGFLQQQHGVQQHGVQQQLVVQQGWLQVGCGQQVGAGQAGAGHGAGHGAGQGAHSTGTLRQRLTHTSTGTHVLTRLQIVQGTFSVTV
jgi:hypothetical protein